MRPWKTSGKTFPNTCDTRHSMWTLSTRTFLQKSKNSVARWRRPTYLPQAFPRATLAHKTGPVRNDLAAHPRMAYRGTDRHGQGTVRTFAGTNARNLPGWAIENATAPCEKLADQNCASSRFGSR